MKNTLNKIFSRHALTNFARIAAIATACVTMSALTSPKPPVAPPTEITFNIDSTDTTDSSDSSDTAQSNLVSACVCDLNQDRTVDSADFGTLLGSFGPCQSGDPGDFNFDAAIDSSDLGTMLGNFGPCPSDLAWATVLQWNPDSDVVLDAAVRAQIIASGFPWRVRDNSSGIEMLLIPGGTFTMGCSASNSSGCYSDENPTHQVTLSKAFYLGKTEVTQAQWLAKMGSNPSAFGGYSDSPSRPVEYVSWNDIAGFNTATGLRLPSEAEWEYSYRGGTTTAFHSMPGYPNGTNDDSLLGNIAWYSSNSESTTHAVAGKAANAFGMYDMSGNVYEWCNDWYGSTYYTTSQSTDPVGPSSGSYRVLRGGNWNNGSYACRSSLRNNYNQSRPDTRSSRFGFRVARTADPAPTVTTISPAYGLTSGGTTITLNGSNFLGASSVTVGGVAATSVNVVSDSVLTAITPPGSIGAAVSVSVTTSNRTATLASAFSYYEAGTLSWAGVLESLPNAAVVTDAAVRANIVASGYPWRVLDTGTGIEMLLIPGGTFTMGCSASNSYDCYSDENPTYQVTLSKAFYLGKTEVTQAQWEAKMGSNPSSFKGYSDSPSRPVETVSWNDIASFNTATGLRLPSEAEWEYACRGGTTTAFHSMPGYPNGTNIDSLLGNIAWYRGNNGATGSSNYGTKPVAGKAANAFGMYDMSGNVWEWCNDWYGSTYYSTSPSTDPAGPSSGSYRVLRGGSWYSYSVNCRSSSRLYEGPYSRYTDVGFRVARSIPYAKPTVAAISPADGLTSGGTTITLNGSNFLGASSVTVGGVAATSVNVVSDSVLTAVTPPGSIGAAVSVSITTSNGTATLASAFSYYEAGTLSWASVLEYLPNAAVVPDAAVRANIVASGYPWRVRDNSSGIEMLLIPDGTFTMGCSASNSYGCNSDENPTHQVTLIKAFYLGKTEVTQAQWQAKMGSNPSYFQPPNYRLDTSRPVEQVSWNDITGFNNAIGLRLPSEAEWEYACRGDTTTAFHNMPGYPNGTNDGSLLGNIAWYSSNSGSTTHAVAGKAANAFGMYDMSGNVSEWCNDWYESSYYSTSPSSDPAGPSSGLARVLRGGGWGTGSVGCRSSDRRYGVPVDRGYNVGFRVARTADPAPTITTISPADGLTSGGTTITLNGSNFLGASSVTVGGVAATSVNVVSDSVLTAVTPPGSIGAAVSVSVTTSNGTATLASAFSYYEALSWASVLEYLPNAAVVPDAAVRANIVASGYPWRVRDNSSGIEMLLIPGGTFTMGCSASNSYGCNSDENPTHQVTLSKAFYLGKTEVTQAQWQAKMGSNPSYFQNYSDSPSRPVEQVSWNDIVGFNTAIGLRLPSEAEWEYACRGGTTTAYHSMPGYPDGTNDDSLLGNIAWYGSNNSPYGTKSVAGKAANAFGIYDMSGNVYEWCNDWYGDYSASDATDPTGPSVGGGSFRVLRGGDWINNSVSCRSSHRLKYDPDTRSFGFRVARTADPAPTITTISPAGGLTSGGTTITLNGSSFLGASSVTVGGVAATSVNVVSDSVLTAVTPPGSIGAAVSVSVTTSNGTATLASAFSYCEALSWASVLEYLPNAAVVPDAAVRANIVASGYPWRVRDNSSGIEMLLIPGGTFTMGCSASNSYGCNSDENPTHQVTLSKAFYLGKTEVTQAQWQAKMGSNPSSFKNYSDSPSRPVERVSWNDIAGFNTATGFRLPSEAEWEYACRGGTTTAYHSMPGYPNGTNDDSLLGNIAWWYSNSSTTNAVAGKAANAFGLYDMSGNVLEWCNDWYGDYSAGNATDPTGPSVGQYDGAFRVLRGGGYDVSSTVLRASYRFYYYGPDGRGSDAGFRVARTADPAPTVTTISPADGLTSGGTTITLNGSNFLGASSVTVGGVAATSVNVVSDSVLTAVTPPGSIGAAVSVSVTTSKGTATLASAFIYYEALSWASVLEFLPNAAVVPDAAVRANIVASGYPWRVLDTGTGIEMLLIPGGTFTMGCSASNSDSCFFNESPNHQVTLSKAFYLGKTEVTQAQWQTKMGSNPSAFGGYSDSPSRPVERVSWNDIAGFNTATGFRLPSEAEWEYACRGGTTTAYHSMPGYLNGTNDYQLLQNIAWFNCIDGWNTHAVAGKAANAFGMYDMLGNVWEWCNDWWGGYDADNATDPAGPSTDSYRVLRGGNYGYGAYYCRSSGRAPGDPDHRDRNDIGFRVARTADPAPTITTISPADGLTSGGTTITLNGSNFLGASSVTVGGVAATSVNVVSDSVLTAVTPPGSIGAAVSVSITTSNGTATLASAFTYFTLSWASVLEALPNAAVVPDATLRAKIVASGYPWRVLDTGTGIELLLIPGGTFTMGCSASNSYGCNSDENPTHQVTLIKAFYLGKTEVTQAQWQAIMGSNPSYFQPPNYTLDTSRPVEQVSWNYIAGFNTATGLRLPSEAEWEYACRGGTTTAFHSMPGYPNGTNDDSLLGNIAWYDSNNAGSDRTHAVAGKAANAFGMYDMSGNVWEWCNDWYESYAAGNVTDPAGPSSGWLRVLRGGSWFYYSVSCRSSYRLSAGPADRDLSIGFRAARTP